MRFQRDQLPDLYHCCRSEHSTILICQLKPYPFSIDCDLGGAGYRPVNLVLYSEGLLKGSTKISSASLSLTAHDQLPTFIKFPSRRCRPSSPPPIPHSQPLPTSIRFRQLQQTSSTLASSNQATSVVVLISSPHASNQMLIFNLLDGQPNSAQRHADERPCSMPVEQSRTIPPLRRERRVPQSVEFGSAIHDNDCDGCWACSGHSRDQALKGIERT